MNTFFTLKIQRRSLWISLSSFVLAFSLLAGLANAYKGYIAIKVFKVQKIKNAKNTYKVQADIKYVLNDHLNKALFSGVTLESSFKFYYKQPNNWFWNKQKFLSSLNLQLTYHTLSRHYLLSRGDTLEHWNFANLPAALRKMGEIRNYELPKLPPKEKDDESYISAIAELRSSNLNLPLRIQLFLSDEYGLISREVRWQLP